MKLPMQALWILLAIFISQLSIAQNQAETILLTNYTLHIGTGKVIKNGMMGIKSGKIDRVEEVNEAIYSSYDKIIDGKGQHLYPGLIAANTRLGLEEIQAVRATRDYREVGNFNPNVRSVIAYNTDSKVVPTVRSNGILMAQIVPEGGRISGQSSVVYTAGDNWEDATLAFDNCVHLRWPSRLRYSGWWSQNARTEINKNYDKNLEAIRVYFDAAKAYSKKKEIDRKNLKFETMRAVFDKTKKLVVHTEDAKSMMDLVSLLEKYSVDIVIQGGTEAYKITDFLKERNIPVILHDIHQLPGNAGADIDQPFKTPALLEKKGIKFAFSLSNQGSWNVRNLPFQAGQAVAKGLDPEAAIRALTLSPAEILGIDKQVGSLEIGKEATFIVSEGDVLDMRTSVITRAYIQGQPISLEDKQKLLYEKYMEKYQLND